MRHMSDLQVSQISLDLGSQSARQDDLYISLVGELFDFLRSDGVPPEDWSRLGNALAQFAVRDRSAELRSIGVNSNEAALFSAASFYFGGFPASACVTMRNLGTALSGDVNRANYDFIVRAERSQSPLVRRLQKAILEGDLSRIVREENLVIRDEKIALNDDVERWISLRLLHFLISRFKVTNLRAVLPNGGSEFWAPLVKSFADRGSWDFFPSQILAIERGLLTRGDSFSLQMPTGSGKTALCETLLFSHLKTDPNATAVFLVPYRSLASELRYSVVKRLNAMGIAARCAYGGTIPSANEIRSYDETRALVATPETLSGILSANVDFAQRISLIICDEGHLLDTPSRGISLELLLARMKTLKPRGLRFVFVSAIVPNIEEINHWLRGTDDSVVRSDYRAAIAEYAVIRKSGNGASDPVDMEMHPHENPPVRYKINSFLSRQDFQYTNSATGRINTYSFSSIKTLAIATARKALPMGTVVVFAANKKGNQGAIGLTEELIEQIPHTPQLPSPLIARYESKVTEVVDYLEREYGAEWIGTRSMRVGAIIHHGDIPQETREVFEELLRQGYIAFCVCTNTLAEGVNFPIRTLVLYSIQRVDLTGQRTDFLIRDVKNLVGRAGRAGSTTKGLVICANEDQWPLLEKVAKQEPGESVYGALKAYLDRVSANIASSGITLSNEVLEASPNVYPLIDGIDATLVDLAAIEIGENEFRDLAVNIANETFAFRRAGDASQQLLRDVFQLRSARIIGFRNAGRLGWIKDTGAKARIVDSVEEGLLPLYEQLSNATTPTDSVLVDALLGWAWKSLDLQRPLKEAYKLGNEGNVDSVRGSFFTLVQNWLSGASFAQIAINTRSSVDDTIGIHTHVIGYTLQLIIDHAIAVLDKLLLEQFEIISPMVARFPEHLRFGVPSAPGCSLAAAGVRHRCAYVTLGDALSSQNFTSENRTELLNATNRLLQNDQEGWKMRLGSLVFANTMNDISPNNRE